MKEKQLCWTSNELSEAVDRVAWILEGMVADDGYENSGN